MGIRWSIRNSTQSRLFHASHNWVLAIFLTSILFKKEYCDNLMFLRCHMDESTVTIMLGSKASMLYHKKKRFPIFHRSFFSLWYFPLDSLSFRCSSRYSQASGAFNSSRPYPFFHAAASCLDIFSSCSHSCLIWITVISIFLRKSGRGGGQSKQGIRRNKRNMIRERTESPKSWEITKGIS